MLSIAELARKVRDDELREIPSEDFEMVFGGCPTQTCETSKGCTDDPDDPDDT